MSTREWITLGCGGAAGVLAVLFGLPIAVAVTLAVAVAVAAFVTVRYGSSAGLYVVLIVPVVAVALADDRPPAWQVMLVAAALAGFVLAPVADRRDLMSPLAAAAGVPLAGAVTVLAQHEGRGSAPYLVGLAALVVLLGLAIRPALQSARRAPGKSS